MLIKRRKGELARAFDVQWQRLHGHALDCLYVPFCGQRLSKPDQKRKRALFKLLQRGY